MEMTGAEFKIAREGLGVSITWISRYLTVGERNIRLWEAGASRVPEGVIKEIGVLEEFTDAYVSILTEKAKTSGTLDTYKTGHEPLDIEAPASWLKLAMPGSWHRHCVWRVTQLDPGIRVDYKTNETNEDSGRTMTS